MNEEINGYLLPNVNYFYVFRVVDITEATGITSWDDFRNKNSKVTSTNVNIEFNSHSNPNDDRVRKEKLIENVDLNKTLVYKIDITKGEENMWDVPIMNGRDSVNMNNIAISVEYNFSKDKCWTIFSESIDYNWAHTNANVRVVFQTYIKNKHLIFRICQMSTLFSVGTTIGSTATVCLGDELLFS